MKFVDLQQLERFAKRPSTYLGSTVGEPRVKGLYRKTRLFPTA